MNVVSARKETFDPTELTSSDIRDLFIAEKSTFESLVSLHLTPEDETIAAWLHFVAACTFAVRSEEIYHSHHPTHITAGKVATTLKRLNTVVCQEGGWGLRPVDKTLFPNRIQVLSHKTLTGLVELTSSS